MYIRKWMVHQTIGEFLSVVLVKEINETKKILDASWLFIGVWSILHYLIV